MSHMLIAVRTVSLLSPLSPLHRCHHACALESILKMPKYPWSPPTTNPCSQASRAGGFLQPELAILLSPRDCVCGCLQYPHYNKYSKCSLPGPLSTRIVHRCPIQGTGRPAEIVVRRTGGDSCTPTRPAAPMRAATCFACEKCR